MAWLLAQVIGGWLRLHPLRALVQVGAIAIGVALGYAVHLINASALAEFSAAVRQVTGQADASLAGSRDGFDETLYARVAADRRVALASPVLEVEAALAEPARLRGRTLSVVGIDALRAAALTPALIGAPDGRAAPADDRLALLGDGLFLAPAALQALGLAVGDRLGVQVGARVVTLRVAGLLPAAREGQALAALDLGHAQALLDRVGRLTRIDLAMASGANAAQAAADWALPAGVSVQTAAAAETRVSNLSRAYRVNLNVLALVALFTGAFLVYSLQAQSVLARSTQLAFLRVIGLRRAEVERLLLVEAAVLGAAGAALGVALGTAAAQGALALLGGDLGSGLFAGTRPALHWTFGAALAFFALGVLAALAGGWMPARAAAAAPPALALKSGTALDEDGGRATPALLLAVLALAGALLLVPAVGGIPVGAYLAIGLLLVAAILAKPLVAPWLFGPLRHRLAGVALGARGAPLWLASARLAATPRFAAVGAAGIVASFALMVAMATMVASFRVSVDQWLTRVLPADLYVRAGPPAAGALGGTSASFAAADQERLRQHPAVARVEFTRNLKVILDPARPPVSLVVRPIDRADPGAILPLAGAARTPRPDEPPPAWISEAVVELYGARVGSVLALPIDGSARPFTVAGVWRDYARQFGAVAVDVADYERLTGPGAPTEAALWLRPGYAATPVMSELQASLATRTAEFAAPEEIRALSLRIFDRSFAVTYVLELAAIVIGMVGIAATFSAQAIARTREFGMLRHLGVSRGQILALLAIEGLLVTALALLLGLATGLAVAWVLVDVVNPQSFHWTMAFRVPAGLVAALIAALLAAAAVTAMLAGRRAVSGAAVLAVREDW